MIAIRLARAGLIIILASTALIGCGRPDQFGGEAGDEFTSASQSLDAEPGIGQKQLDVSAAVTKAIGATRSVENAIYEAQGAISEISDDNGNIALNVFKTFFSAPVTVKRGGLLSPFTNRLQTAFDGLFKKAAAVKANITAARLALTVANAQLDLTDPAQAVIATQIIAQMAALDAMETSLKAGMTALAGKVDQAQTGLTKLVSLGTSFIPIPGLNYVADLLINTFLLGDLTSLLNSMKLKLLSF